MIVRKSEREIELIAAAGRVAADTVQHVGQQVKPILESGQLVPDEITVGLIRERLAEPDAADGFVLDGFPRNLDQADELDAMLAEIGRSLDAVLYFNVPDSVGMARALERAKLEGRTDDTPEVIGKRLEIYHRETEPIVEHYRTRGKLIPIRAERSIEEVAAEIGDILEGLS